MSSRSGACVGMRCLLIFGWITAGSQGLTRQSRKSAQVRGADCRHGNPAAAGRRAIGYAFGSAREQHGNVWGEVRSTYAESAYRLNRCRCTFSVVRRPSRTATTRHRPTSARRAIPDPAGAPQPSCLFAKTSWPKPPTVHGMGGAARRENKRCLARRSSTGWDPQLFCDVHRSLAGQRRGEQPHLDHAV